MSHRSIFICDESLWERALAWAGAGLVGESLWLVAPDGPVGDVVLTPARRLPGEEIGPLGDFLSAETALEKVLLIWCVTSGQPDPQHPWNLHAVQELRSHLGQQSLTGVAVFPAPGQPQVRLPQLSPEWSRVVLGPEEAIVPGGADASVRDPAADLLHAALGLGGVICGNQPHPPEVLVDAGWGQGEVCATAYTSTVVGGTRLDAAARDHHELELPWADASMVRPGRFDRSRGELLMERAHRHVVNAGGSPLRRLELDPGYLAFEENRRITFRGLLENFSGFVDFLFLHSRPVSWRGRMHDVLADRLQRANSGWEIERSGEEPGVIPVIDAFALDREQRGLLQRCWENGRHASGDLPSPEALQALTTATNGMIDASDLPPGLERPDHHGRPCIIEPLPVLGCATPDGDLVPSVPQEEGEIAGIRHAPASAAVKATAESAVRRHLGAPGAKLTGTGRRGSRVTHELAEEIAGKDSEIRQEQLAGCGEATPVDGLSFLDRVRASVLADGVAARLDADRWCRIAVGELGGLIPLRPARFWFWFCTGLAATAAMVLANLFWPGTIIDLFSRIGIALTGGQVWGGVGGFSTLFVAGPVVWFFNHFNEYRTRSIRQAEARKLMFLQAITAMDEHLRLANADRVVRLWSQVLRGIYPLRDVEPACVATTPPVSVPRSWTLVHPGHDEQQLRAWLAAEATGSPWRRHAFDEILNRHHGPGSEDLSALWQDPGLPDGPLEWLARDVDRLWAELLDERVDDLGRRLRERVLTSDDPVDPEGNSPLGLGDFLGRVEVPDHIPGLTYQRPPVPDRAGSLGLSVSPDRGGATREVIASHTRIYQRLLEPLPAEATPWPEPEEGRY